jgi:predicted  nucleic acid-binding Zn-ribbon protein
MSRPSTSGRKYLNGGASMATDEMRQLALPPNLLHYCKTIQRRFSNPLIEMRNGVCTGCFMSLSSGQRQKIENETTYGVCESCGRILYYEEL